MSIAEEIRMKSWNDTAGLELFCLSLGVNDCYISSEFTHIAVSGNGAVFAYKGKPEFDKTESSWDIAGDYYGDNMDEIGFISHPKLQEWAEHLCWKISDLGYSDDICYLIEGKIEDLELMSED